MKCSLCGKEIENYNQEFNQLKLSDSKYAEICNDCIDKFVKWQGNIYSKLFPTSVMKKLHKK